ncbi:MAG: tetratricopeptide repeat protein [Pseudoflavonifractor sp.]|nr:tetratricopeptide repeat protein [Alloprevotella sp.]MCM1116175.1 tetratricopeptide repeat protein [Pseudoflavonifractor sp.]
MRHLTFIILLLAVAATALSETHPGSAEASRRQRKADMIYLEALRHKENGDIDAYVDLLTQAYKTYPSDPFLGFEYGQFMAAITEHKDSVVLRQAYDLMRRYAMDGEGAKDYDVVSATAMLASDLLEMDDCLEMRRRLYVDNPDRPQAALGYAMTLAIGMNPDDLRHAEEIFDTVETREGPSIPLSFYKIQLFQLQNDTAKVINEARRITRVLPPSAEPLLFAADIYSDMNAPDSALALLNRAVELEPTNGKARYNLANFHLERGDSAAYNREIYLAMEQPELDPETRYMLLEDYIGRLYRDTTQFAQVSSLFDHLIETMPHDPTIRGYYGDYLAYTKHYPQAAEQIDYEISLNPADSTRWGMLISCYFQTGDINRALSTAEKGLKLFPYDTYLPLAASTALSEIGNYSKAIATMEGALEIPGLDDSDKSKFLTTMGDIMQRMELTDSADVYYDQAIEVDPTNYLAMNNLAYHLACNDQDLDRALTLIETVDELSPDNPTYLDTYAWVMFKRSDYAKAKELIDRTIELSETQGEDLSAEVLEHAGDIYFMSREPDRALDFWKKALALDPDNRLLRRKVTSKTYFYE